MSEEEAVFIVNQFLEGPGVCYPKFLYELRGKLNQARYQAIVDAYSRAKKVIGDNITL